MKIYRSISKLSFLLLGFPALSSSFLTLVSAQERVQQQCSNEDSQDGTCKPNESNTMTSEEVIFAPLGKPSDFTTSSTGVKLAVRKYIPENPKAVLIWVHGGAGFHSGYTKILGDYMQSNDIAVIAYDQMGSGYSDGAKVGDKEYRQYFDSMETTANDFTKVLMETRKEFPGLKVFGVGESFGCMILLKQVVMEQQANASNLADGYVLTGPVVKLLPEMLPPSFALTIMKFLAKFFPMLTMPATDFFSTFDLAFGDQRWAKAGRADPMIQEAAATPPKLGQATSVLSTMDYVYDNMDTIQVPFEIFMGEHEGRVDTNAVKKLAEASGSKDKGLTIVPGAYHQLFQDKLEVTISVCDGIKKWVTDRV